MLQRVAGAQKYPIDGKRLFEEIIRPQLGRLDRRLDRPVARNHHNHRPVCVRNRLNPVQRLEAVDTRQPDIQNHQFEDGARKKVQTSFAVLDSRDLKAFVFQYSAQGLSNARLVVDDQDARSFHW